MDASAHFKGKKITVMGLGLLGRGVGDTEFLASCGAELIVTDLKSEEELTESLKRLSRFPNIQFVLGEHRLQDFENRDLILKAAGVPLDSAFVAHAKEEGISVRMSSDLFAEISGIPVIGVTGTRGKSTVTQMVHDILLADGRKVLLGGNVRGVSTLSLLKEATPEHVGVLELDSWQCHGFGEAKMSPHTAVFTTFMDDHLLYYKNDVQTYLNDKAQIFLNQKENDMLILGEQAAPFVLATYKSRIRSGIVTPEALGASVELQIPGAHNRYNAALAVATTQACGVSEEIIFNTLRTFKGLQGRLELVVEKNGIRFYNDTNSTTSEATLVALRALGENRNIVLIMGGHDKGLDMSELIKELPCYTKRVIMLAGTGTSRVLPMIEGASVYDNLKGAFEEAVRGVQEGDVVLMSPAFASFGIFKNEYDRGDQFTALAKAYE